MRAARRSSSWSRTLGRGSAPHAQAASWSSARSRYAAKGNSSSTIRWSSASTSARGPRYDRLGGVAMVATKGRATITDVATEAGVLPSTVSRVLTGHAGSRIKPATRERVLTAADHLGYRASALARSLRLQRTLTLGMLVPDITNPFFSSIIKGAEDAARQQGYNLILCNSEDEPEREATYLRVL